MKQTQITNIIFHFKIATIYYLTRVVSWFLLWNVWNFIFEMYLNKSLGIGLVALVAVPVFFVLSNIFAIQIINYYCKKIKVNFPNRIYLFALIIFFDFIFMLYYGWYNSIVFALIIQIINIIFTLITLFFISKKLINL